MTDRIAVSKTSPATSFYLEADLLSQNIVGNYSTIRCYLRANNGPGGLTSSQFNNSGSQTGSIDGVGAIGSHSGNPFLPSGYVNGAQRWRDGPYDINVGHASNGTLGTLTVRMVLNYGSIVNENFTGTIGSFPTIPRASTPSFSPAPVDAGATVTITTNRADASFTHTLSYAIGSASGTIATGVGASTTWVVPASLQSQFPNSATGNVTITTQTYSGATLIGTTTKTMVVAAPATTVPDFTTVTCTEATAGVAANIGGFVQGISTLALAITGATGIFGSTIVSYKIEVAGQTINAVSGTTTPILSSGTVNIVGTVTDSRGRIKQKTVPITVLAYSPPSFIATPTVHRALNTAVIDDDDGTYFRVDINAAVQSLVVSTQRNAINYRISTRVKGTTTWTVNANTAPGGITFNSYGLFGTFLLTSSYDILVEVYDDFTTSAVILTLPVAAVFMHWDGSLGVGVGKFRERGRFDAQGDGYFSGRVWQGTGPNMGTTAERDSYWGVPSGASAISALANLRPQWFNTDVNRWESYYATTGTSGLTVLGLLTGHASGWYPMPGSQLRATRVKRNGYQLISGATYVDPVLATMEVNIGGFTDYANSGVTVPIGGYYKVSGSIYFTGGASSYVATWIYRSGTQITAGRIPKPTSFDVDAPVVEIIPAVTGQNLSITAISDSGINLYGPTTTLATRIDVQYVSPPVVNG